MHPHPKGRSALARAAVRITQLALLAGLATAASAQPEPSCEQLAAGLKTLGLTAAANPQADAATTAATAAGAQMLGALAQQAGARNGLGGLFSGLVGGTAPAPAAQAQAAAVQVAALHALAQPRGTGHLHVGQAAQAAGMLGGLVSATQAAQPVATPGNAAIQQLAGSRHAQLGGLFLAKGCQ